MGRKVAIAAQYLADVAEGKEEPKAGRMRACEMLLDRVVGKPKESVDVRMSVAAQVETLPWVQAIRNSVRVNGEHVIDTTATRAEPEATECACGCGMTTDGARYLNEAHRAHAERQTGPTLDDDDDFIEETDDELVFEYP